MNTHRPAISKPGGEFEQSPSQRERGSASVEASGEHEEHELDVNAIGFDTKSGGNDIEAVSQANAFELSNELSSLGEFMFYNPPRESSGSSTAENIPSEFFEPTAADLKSAQATLSARAKAFQEAPLLTEKLRTEKEQERRKRWSTAIIRIKFANRALLEKSFSSTCRIKSVYAFVRACLREDIRPCKFVLYETPPRRDLKVSDQTVKDKSLYELHLVPRSVLHFRFLEEHVKFDLPSGPPPLLPEVLSRAIDLPPSPTQVEKYSRPTPSESATSLDTTPRVSSASDQRITKLLRLAKGKK